MTSMALGDPRGDPGSAFRWEEARVAVVPLLARRPPMPPGGPVMVWLDPGLRVGFGVDVGPMFVHVTGPLLRAWRVDMGALTRQAVGNLRERARELEPGAAVRARYGLVPLSALQVAGGWASSLVLVPDLLPRWFGPGPRIFIAPARNLLVALPVETDARLVRSVRDEIGARLPDALDVPPLTWDGVRLRREAVGDDLVPPTTNGPLRPRADRGVPPRRWTPLRQGARTTWYTPPPDRSVT